MNNNRFREESELAHTQVIDFLRLVHTVRLYMAVHKPVVMERLHTCPWCAAEIKSVCVLRL